MNSRTIIRAIVLAALQLLAAGCGGKESAMVSTRFASEFHIADDDGDAVAGAVIAAGKMRLGTTGPDGILRTELAGADGQTLPVTVSCPDGLTGPEKPASLRLTHTRRVNLSGYQPMRVEAVCQRNVRNIVLVARVQGGAALPLQVDGKPAGTTDADGIAHVLVKVDRNVKALNVSLDTSGRKELKPRNPSRTYELIGSDGLFVFDQVLVAKPTAIFHAGGSKPRKHIPYRVD
jgi:hypothetical protein